MRAWFATQWQKGRGVNQQASLQIGVCPHRFRRRLINALESWILSAREWCLSFFCRTPGGRPICGSPLSFLGTCPMTRKRWFREWGGRIGRPKFTRNVATDREFTCRPMLGIAEDVLNCYRAGKARSLSRSRTWKENQSLAPGSHRVILTSILTRACDVYGLLNA